MADAARTSLLSPEAMGSFDAEGNYTPRTIVDDDLADADLEQAMGDSIIEFDDGDVIEGTVVKIDRDEVLLDIGFKSEGVIPARELSIRNDVDPEEIVSLGDHVEALVLQKEDKEGRLVLSKKRAQYERAWTTIEEKKNNGEMVSGPVIEVVKGGLIVDIGLRGFLPASLVELRRVRELQPYVGKVIEAKIIELDRDDAKYLEYLRQPCFHNNQPNEFFSHERLLNQFEKIFTTPITPVSARRYPLQIDRWIPVLKNRSNQ